MNNKGSKARFIFVSICCLCVIIYSSYDFLFIGGNTKITNSIKTKSNTNLLQKDFEFYNDFPNEISDTVQKISDKSTAVNDKNYEKMVQAASNATVSGKVIEKFISPYTSKLSYNSVYIKNSTNLKNIDVKSLLNAPLKFKLKKNSTPQILILHTHATESFLLNSRDYYTVKDVTRTTDNNYNMIALGNIVADSLNGAGFKTLHSLTQHDYPSYNESYSRAADTICSYKSKYKDLKIVIDMHRDALSSGDTDKVKLTTMINGKKAAQIMIVMGSQSGNVKNFPNWQENMKLAVKLQRQLEVMYPSLARALSLTSKNYNESLTTGSMLIEIGTDANSLDEVRYSAQLLADALVALCNTLT